MFTSEWLRIYKLSIYWSTFLIPFHFCPRLLHSFATVLLQDPKLSTIIKSYSLSWFALCICIPLPIKDQFANSLFTLKLPIKAHNLLCHLLVFNFSLKLEFSCWSTYDVCKAKRFLVRLFLWLWVKDQWNAITKLQLYSRLLLLTLEAEK